MTSGFGGGTEALVGRCGVVDAPGQTCVRTAGGGIFTGLYNYFMYPSASSVCERFSVVFRSISPDLAQLRVGLLARKKARASRAPRERERKRSHKKRTSAAASLSTKCSVAGEVKHPSGLSACYVGISFQP